MQKVSAGNKFAGKIKSEIFFFLAGQSFLKYERKSWSRVDFSYLPMLRDIDSSVIRL